MVIGEADPERLFALVTLAVREASGDVRAGITAALQDVIEHYELYGLNFVLGELGHIWAFCHPSTIRC